MDIFIFLNFVFLLIILTILIFRKERNIDDIILKQDELKERILIFSKEFSETLANTRLNLNREITNILKNTEMLIIDEVNKTISTLGTTDTNLQQRMENLRVQLHQTLTDTVKNLTNSINQTTNILTSNLDTKLEDLNKRFADTTGLISDLNLKVGQLSKTTEELKKINEELKIALTSPKLGGDIGEQILENMLKNLLPKEVYEFQYFISPGNIVDAVIFIENKFIPIDAKFPILSYKKMVNSKEEEYEYNKQEFIRIVKDHIEKVSKYIQPEKGSFNFAFMYIPSEPIFYSLLISEDKDGSSIFNYSWSKKRVFACFASKFICIFEYYSAWFKR